MLPEGVTEGEWHGWPFGRSLYVAELFSVIQQVPGVKHVLDVQLRQRPVMPSKESPPLGQLEDFADAASRGATDAALTPVSGRVLQVTPDTLICSLNHEVVVVEL
jgi:hypothetical protein